MRLFFKLSTVEFRLPTKDKPQTGSNTDTRTAVSGTIYADTRLYNIAKSPYIRDRKVFKYHRDTDLSAKSEIFAAGVFLGH